MERADDQLAEPAASSAAPAAPAPPLRLWRGCLIALAVLAAPFLLGGAFLLEENVRGRIQLRAAQQALRGDGVHLTFAESGLPAPVPPGNAASAVFAAAAELAKLAEGSRLVSSGPHGLMKLAAPGTATCAYREQRFPSFNAYRSSNHEGPAADDWLLANAQLAAAKAPLDRLRAALRQPVLMVEDDYSARGPSMGKLYGAHSWLMSHGVCALHAGDLDTTIDDIAAACNLARLTRSDLRLEAQKSAEMIDTFATFLIWEALQAGGWTDERLSRLQAAAHDGEQLTTALRCCDLQPAFSRALFDSARSSVEGRSIAARMQGRDLSEDLLGAEPPPMPSETSVQLRAFLWWAAWSRQDEARSLEEWRPFLDSTRKMGSEHSWINFARRTPKTKTPGGGPLDWRWLVSDLLSPTSGRYLLASLVRSETERQMALTAIAIRRWELANNGTPPLSLDALRPKFLAETPLDYMTGQPLRYRLNAAGGYKLYSVGLDGKDDGGDPSSTTGDSRVRSLWGGRDAVWPKAVNQPD